MSRIQLVIFDFDGTLIDTAPDLIRATNEFLSSKGIDALPESKIRQEIGMGLRKLILDVYPEKNLTPAAQQRVTDEFTAIYETHYLNAPTLFSGALEFLCEWDGLKSIVSNKRERFIGPILSKLKLESLGWTDVIGGDTLEQMKPHPLPFLKAMATAGVTPQETLIVGDGLPDVLGAVAIGSPCVAVEFGYTPFQQLMALGAQRSIASYNELPALIASIT